MYSWLKIYLQAHAMAVFPKDIYSAHALEGRRNYRKVTQPKFLL